MNEMLHYRFMLMNYKKKGIRPLPRFIPFSPKKEKKVENNRRKLNVEWF